MIPLKLCATQAISGCILSEYLAVKLANAFFHGEPHMACLVLQLPA